MNRRALITTALAASALPAAAQALPALTTRDLITHDGKVLWTRAARASEHAAMIEETVSKIVGDGIVELTDKDGIAYLDYIITLREPRFEVDMGKTWDLNHGWNHSELSPRLRIFEGTVHVGDCYTWRAAPGDKSWLDKRAGLRRPVVVIESLKQDFPHQVDFDMRWLEQYAAMRKGAAA
ncbi:hypothetical protein KIKIMORA_01750 [Brevundimonas phage vB_BpoS-Kikimora]|uniref:Uncharacterized protein n=1 Tax=Brevundimonas phage vB_BpoS-Kikimora TaxID=2948601 RepID=A0A9E7MTE9_9CAUD|nr:hypothetical protein KIKIMORA_01750 [Brevundimonas phage vB_BpoS-Kikimora]